MEDAMMQDLAEAVLNAPRPEKKLYLPWEKTEKMDFNEFLREYVEPIHTMKLGGYIKEDVESYFRELSKRYTDFTRKRTGIPNMDSLPKIRVAIHNGMDPKEVKDIKESLEKYIKREVAKIKNSKKFVSLGVTKCGKTTFMASMYYKMTMPVEGFQLSIEDDEQHQKLKNIYEKMVDTQSEASSRFPSPTNQTESYLFALQFKHELIDRFEWLDYKGGILQTGRGEELEKLKHDISEAEVLYVFVDGELFKDRPEKNMEDMVEDVLYDVGNACARDLNHFMSNYASTNLRIPPIAIIVTKYDLIYKEFHEERNLDHQHIISDIVNKVVQEVFSGLFVEQDEKSIGYNSMIGVIPVSLGSEISENNYHGKFEPDNVQFAALTGVWFLLNKETENSTLSNQASVSEKRVSLIRKPKYEEPAENKENEKEKKTDAMKIIQDSLEKDDYIKFYINGREKKFSECAEVFLKKQKGVL